MNSTSLKKFYNYLYWSKLPTQHGFWRLFFVFIFIKIFFFDNTFWQWLQFDCAEKKVFGPRTGLLDENRKSCCTRNWLVLYGNLVCHSTIHWLSKKYQKLYVVIRGRASGLWTLRRVSRGCHCSISTISRWWEKYHKQCNECASNPLATLLKKT